MPPNLPMDLEGCSKHTPCLDPNRPNQHATLHSRGNACPGLQRSRTWHHTGRKVPHSSTRAEDGQHKLRPLENQGQRHPSTDHGHKSQDEEFANALDLVFRHGRGEVEGGLVYLHALNRHQQQTLRKQRVEQSALAAGHSHSISTTLSANPGLAREHICETCNSGCT